MAVANMPGSGIGELTNSKRCIKRAFFWHHFNRKYMINVCKPMYWKGRFSLGREEKECRLLFCEPQEKV